MRPVYQLGAAGLLALAAVEAGAQEQAATAPAAAAEGIQEVVVTSQRRAENIQNVPIAVTAFTAESLQTRGLGDIHALSQLTPGVNLDSGSPFSGDSSVLSASIRGIGQDDFAFNLNPGVGVYLDGVYLARTIGANQNLMDVDRVEILKGPQGSLFGANTIGGAISIVTHEPGNEARIIAQATGGSLNRRDFAFTADLPIVKDVLLSTITVSSQHRDGWVKVIPYPTDSPQGSSPYVVDPQTAYPKAGYQTSDDFGGQGLDVIRGKLSFRPSDSFSLTLAADWSHENQTALPYTVLGVYNGTDNLGTGGDFNSIFATLYNACISNGTAPGTAVEYGAFGALTCQQPRARVPGLSAGGAPLGGAGYVGGPAGPYQYSAAAIAAGTYLGSSSPRLYFDCNAASTGRIITTTGFGTCAAPGTGLDTTYANGPDFARYDAFGFSLTGVLKLTQDLQLKSITGYRQIDWRIGTDLDGTPETLQEVSDHQHQFQVSEELQLLGSALGGNLNYVGGLYFFKESGYVHDYVPFESLLYVYDFANDITNKDYAAFFHVDWRIGDHLGLTAGGRFTTVETSFLGGQGDLNHFPFGDGNPEHYFIDASGNVATVPDSQKWQVFDPTVGVQWHFNKDVMLYASWSKGFKQGGWTTRLQGVETLADARFSPEYSKTYELGLKSQWFDRHLQANAAVFYTDYTGIQLNVQQNISPVYLNAGNAKIKGGELELQAIVGRGLSLNFAGSYIDAYYTYVNPNAFIPQYPEPDGTIHCPALPDGTQPLNAAGTQPACLPYPGVVSTDAKLPKTPKYKFSVFPEYDFVLPSDATVRVITAFTYTADMYNDALNTPLLHRPATRDLSASIHYVSPNDMYDVAFGGTNLTDDRYVTGGSPNYGAGEVGGYFNPPRQWYISVKARLTK